MTAQTPVPVPASPPQTSPIGNPLTGITGTDSKQNARRQHLPHRRMVTAVLWAWMLFWLMGVVVYIVNIPTWGLGLSFAGIGICLVALVVAVWVGDLWHLQTRSRLRRTNGQWPTNDELRGYLWRRHDARWAKVAKGADAMGGPAGVLLHTVQDGMSAVGEKIDDIQKERANSKIQRRKEIERRAARALSEAEQRYAVRQRGANIDDTRIRFRIYITEAAYREDSVNPGYTGWYQQVDEDPSFRYTFARDGFVLVTWRCSTSARQVIS